MFSPPLLNVRSLGKSYPATKGQPSRWAIRNLTFSVSEGELLTIVGPSGAGKTTLLNLLAQVDAATEGEIQFAANVVSVGPDTRLDPGLSCRVGYVTQDENLLPWRTALENVLLPLIIQRRLTESTQVNARALMEAVGLAGFEHHYPHELSGGMRKRVSLIRTLVYDPPVILMDEPFSTVDAETRTNLQEDLLALWALRRKTIVFVTHDIAEAITLGDRTLVLTRAPARVQREHSISLPRPRDVRALGGEPAFWDLFRTIRADVQRTCEPRAFV